MPKISFRVLLELHSTKSDACVLILIQLKIFSNLPCDFFFDSWVTRKCIVQFLNILGVFSDTLLVLISNLIALLSKDIPCMSSILSNDCDLFYNTEYIVSW